MRGTSNAMRSEPPVPSGVCSSISADRLPLVIIHHSSRKGHQGVMCVKVHKYRADSATALRATTQEFVLRTYPYSLLKYSPSLTRGNKYPALMLRSQRRDSQSGTEPRRPLFPRPLRDTPLAARPCKTYASSLCSRCETKWHIVALLAAIPWVIQMLFQHRHPEQITTLMRPPRKVLERLFTA
jgi:hypothetical protein